MSSVHFSSKSHEWSTPIDLFNKLDSNYGFDLDPCCTHDNAKCENHYTSDEDGLSQEWFGNVFMNPPYGREISKWIEKAFNEVEKGNAELVVCLLPSRTDTKWFHEYCLKGDVEFIKGRLKFGDSKNSAPFPSMIVKFRKINIKY